MPERLALLNLLVNHCEVVCNVLGILLIKGCHSEFLMSESRLLAAARSVTIVGIVSAVFAILLGSPLFRKRVDSVLGANEALIF